jgi:hypothetical protein
MPVAYTEKQRSQLQKITASDLTDESIFRAVDKVAACIDAAHDLVCKSALRAAVDAITTLRQRQLSSTHDAVLHYFEGNAWSGLQSIERETTASHWAWDDFAMGQRISCFRRALVSDGYVMLDPYRRAQTLTNLGTAMSNLGRFVEAVEYWQRAIKEHAELGMALAAKAEGLLFCCRYLYDEGHRREFAHSAYWAYRDASEKLLEGQSPEHVQRQIFELEQWAPQLIGARPVYNTFSLGRTKDEQSYRRWCVENMLFLNPMNVITQRSVSANDVMSLPPMRGSFAEIARGRGFVGLFNAMKQEYIAARAAAYKGLDTRKRQFADRDVHLQDTLDVRSYGLHLEQQKIAFRVAYSIFDKVAYFLNEYFRLGIKPSQVSFRTLWYANEDKRLLREVFIARKNWPLRGLFWLSKDLAAHDSSVSQESLEPDARGVAKLRNALEHKCVRLFDVGVDPSEQWDEDAFALTLTVSAMQGYTLRILKKARAAMMYLSMAVHLEEREREGPESGERAAAIGGPSRRHAR